MSQVSASAVQIGVESPSPHVTQTRCQLATTGFELVRASDPTLRLILNMACSATFGTVAIMAWDSRYWPVTILSWLLGGHFLHTFALTFHDAAHGTLHPDRRLNELLGHFYGTLILVPLTVYRRAHSRHHARLASPDDPELYPFVIPGTSRVFRLGCAGAEIVLGFFYTPLLFLRSTLTDRKLTPLLRRRILGEYALILAVIAPMLIGIWLTGHWGNYVIGVVVPALVAGTYQTLRKYTEHLGLCGSTILHSTRSILPRNHWNEAISWLLQHVDHHGTHHVSARIPFNELPPASEEVYRDRTVDLPVYESYASALLAMLLTLPDPKAGPQWRSDRAFHKWDTA